MTHTAEADTVWLRALLQLDDRRLKNLDPSTVAKVLDGIERDAAHLRRWSWGCLSAAIFTVALSGWLAAFAFNSNALASAGALGFGTVSTVSIFLTGRALGSIRKPKAQ